MRDPASAETVIRERWPQVCEESQEIDASSPNNRSSPFCQCKSSDLRGLRHNSSISPLSGVSFWVKVCRGHDPAVSSFGCLCGPDRHAPWSGTRRALIVGGRERAPQVMLSIDPTCAVWMSTRRAHALPRACERRQRYGSLSRTGGALAQSWGPAFFFGIPYAEGAEYSGETRRRKSCSRPVNWS